jgi:hypothetical protein
MILPSPARRRFAGRFMDGVKIGIKIISLSHHRAAVYIAPLTDALVALAGSCIVFPERGSAIGGHRCCVVAAGISHTETG